MQDFVDQQYEPQKGTTVQPMGKPLFRLRNLLGRCCSLLMHLAQALPGSQRNFRVPGSLTGSTRVSLMGFHKGVL